MWSTSYVPESSIPALLMTGISKRRYVDKGNSRCAYNVRFCNSVLHARYTHNASSAQSHFRIYPHNLHLNPDYTENARNSK